MNARARKAKTTPARARSKKAQVPDLERQYHRIMGGFHPTPQVVVVTEPQVMETVTTYGAYEEPL